MSTPRRAVEVQNLLARSGFLQHPYPADCHYGRTQDSSTVLLLSLESQGRSDLMCVVGAVAGHTLTTDKNSSDCQWASNRKACPLSPFPPFSADATFNTAPPAGAECSNTELEGGLVTSRQASSSVLGFWEL